MATGSSGVGAGAGGTAFATHVQKARSRTTPVIKADGTLPVGCILMGAGGDWYRHHKKGNGEFTWTKLRPEESDKYTGTPFDMLFTEAGGGGTFRVKCLDFPRP
jgi:hypothetical protein